MSLRFHERLNLHFLSSEDVAYFFQESKCDIKTLL